MNLALPQNPLIVVATVSISLSAFFKPNLSDASEGMPLSQLQVPSGYTLQRVAGPDLVDYPMFATLDATGRLFVFESAGNVYEATAEALEAPQFRIVLLEDEDGDGHYDSRTVFADKVGFPQGGVFYEGSLIASSAPDLLKLTDTAGDGRADKREVLLTGWELNVNANSLIGPFLAPDGWLYLTSAIEGFDVNTLEGHRLKGDTARIWRLKPDGSQLEWISAGGMNNPVELAFTAASEPIGTETFYNIPRAGLRDALVYWIYGGVYPKKDNNIVRDDLPLTGELMPAVSRYSRVAPSGIARYRSNGFGEDARGDLFTAEFNTRRVVRHELTRQGASFDAVPEPFLWTDHSDFHPTDVLEDADGSLLVVETGGWFIKGCPLSKVSKPELQGSIYRIVKDGATAVADPYGNAIGWDSLSPNELVDLLEDDRPFVVDRSMQALAKIGEGAVAPLGILLKQSQSGEARTLATFTLSRIGTPAALGVVRNALRDSNLETRIAAARVAGMAKDAQAVQGLREMAVNDDPAARRQAATALGQIGDAGAVPSLLVSADRANDRFTEHAAIYSLLSIGEPELLHEALKASTASIQVKKAALIALDQMEGEQLQPSDVTPYLDSENETLSRVALWVASHHPEWAESLSSYLERRLESVSKDSAQSAVLRELLVSFSASTTIQQLVASRLEKASPGLQSFLLGAMADYPDEALPSTWIPALERLLLSGTNSSIVQEAINLIRLRDISDELGGALRKIASEESSPAGLRIEAISALLDDEPNIEQDDFAFLFTQLESQSQAQLRQQAAAALAEADLTDAQQTYLVDEYIPQADAFLLPRLLPVFEGATRPETGIALATALENSKSLDSFTRERIEQAFESYPSAVEPALRSLLSKLEQVHAERLARIESLESLISPDTVAAVERGRELFFGKGICYTCHAVGDQGGLFGPDLTSISVDRTSHDLVEAIAYPSATFVREYETYKITTEKGSYVGIISERMADSLILTTSPQTSLRISNDEILSTEVLDYSLMPQGLDRVLSDEEMGDLLSFLMGQNR